MILEIQNKQILIQGIMYLTNEDKTKVQFNEIVELSELQEEIKPDLTVIIEIQNGMIVSKTHTEIINLITSKITEYYAVFNV